MKYPINDTMTFGEIFMAIRQGDLGVALGFGLECLIMALPVIIVGAAVIFGGN